MRNDHDQMLADPILETGDMVGTIRSVKTVLKWKFWMGKVKFHGKRVKMSPFSTTPSQNLEHLFLSYNWFIMKLWYTYTNYIQITIHKPVLANNMHKK